MLRGKTEGEMALLPEGSSVKESPEDKQASVPCVRGSTLMWGAHILCKIRASARIFRQVRIFCYTGRQGMNVECIKLRCRSWRCGHSNRIVRVAPPVPPLIAQLVEHQTGNPEVMGSIPT